MPFDSAGRAFHDGRKPSSRLPSWATDAERAEVERLDVARKVLMAERGATANNGYDSNRPATEAEDALSDEMFSLMRAIDARKSAPSAEDDWAATSPLPPKPDLAIAKAFWSALSPNDPRVRLRFVKAGRGGAREYWADNMEAIWPKVVELQAVGYECYYILNIAPHSDGRGWQGMVEDADITGIRALAADFDKKGLPVWEWHAPPDLIVNSSVVNGIQKGQALWLAADCPVDGFTAAQERLIAFYEEAGVPADASIVNPSRILRLPGSLHQKDSSNPQLVTFIGAAAPTPRPLANLLAGLPPAAERKTKSKEPLGERHKVDADLLMQVLPFIDPACPSNDPKVSVRNVWMGLISGIKNTDFGPEVDGLDIAKRWSAGEFWKDGEPANYAGEDGVEHAYKTSDGNSTFGTWIFHAKQGGWVRPERERIEYGYIPPHNTEEDVVQDAPAPERKEREGQIDLMDVDRLMEITDPTELVEGLLFEGENVCFAGPPKSGKSFIALEIALSIAAGTDDVEVLAHKKVLKTGNVIYLSGEGHGGMKRRVRAWLKERGLDKSAIRTRFFYNRDVPRVRKNVDQRGIIEEALTFVKKIKEKPGQVVLVIVDTMARSLAGNNENDSGVASLYLDMTEALRNLLNCTILTVAHTGKERKDDIRGSSAFTGGFDAVWFADQNTINSSVMLHAKWLKDADQDECPPLYFKLKKIWFDGEKKTGAVLEAVDASVFAQSAAKPVEKTAYKYPGESDWEIVQLLKKAGAINYEKGVWTDDLAEQIINSRTSRPATPEETQAQATDRLKCVERLNKRRKASSLATQENNLGKLNWKWHLANWKEPTVVEEVAATT
jgi:RecA-family ATPase